MTTLSHGNRIAQNAENPGAARLERAVLAAAELTADLRGIFTNWTAARSELVAVGRKAKMARRSTRMMRTAV